MLELFFKGEIFRKFLCITHVLEKLDLEDGAVVEIEVKKSSVDQLFGLIKIQNKELLDEIIDSPDLEPI